MLATLTFVTCHYDYDSSQFQVQILQYLLQSISGIGSATRELTLGNGAWISF